jgi:hypothetical protein
MATVVVLACAAVYAKPQGAAATVARSAQTRITGTLSIPDSFQPKSADIYQLRLLIIRIFNVTIAE